MHLQINKKINLLSANPTKWSNKLKSTFEHSVGLALEGLRLRKYFKNPCYLFCQLHKPGIINTIWH